jgi:UDP-N-acetylglucosamine 2-epimerase
VRALQAHGGLAFKIIHTGQHYDREMNDVFFEELGIPEPDVFMAAGGGSHAQQTGKIMTMFEELCQAERPDAVLVVGDVNSTLACSIVAKKLNIPVAHVEAGLRSGDMTMPEEINRLVTDSISDWFFVTEPSGVAHLKREGKADDAIHYVGHVMVDNLLYQAEKLARTDTSGFETSAFKARHTADGGRYGVITLHRPSNVDSAEMMTRIGGALKEIAQELPLIFPVHPRTRANLTKFGVDLGHHAGRAAGLHGVFEPVETRGCGADRQWRPAGRDHGAGGSVHHDSRKHRATCHRRRGLERAGRDRPGSHRGRGAQSAARRRQGRPQTAPVGWAGGHPNRGQPPGCPVAEQGLIP